LPDEVVAPRPRLRQLIAVLCAEMAASFAARGMTLPPWRRQQAVESKWLPQRSRDAPVAPAGAASPCKRQLPQLKLQQLSFVWGAAASSGRGGGGSCASSSWSSSACSSRASDSGSECEGGSPRAAAAAAAASTAADATAADAADTTAADAATAAAAAPGDAFSRLDDGELRRSALERRLSGSRGLLSDKLLGIGGGCDSPTSARGASPRSSSSGSHAAAAVARADSGEFVAAVTPTGTVSRQPPMFTGQPATWKVVRSAPPQQQQQQRLPSLRRVHQ
jgi:hypothetical protein